MVIIVCTDTIYCGEPLKVLQVAYMKIFISDNIGVRPLDFKSKS